jgi:hypothetical protein
MLPIDSLGNRVGLHHENGSIGSSGVASSQNVAQDQSPMTMSPGVVPPVGVQYQTRTIVEAPDSQLPTPYTPPSAQSPFTPSPFTPPSASSEGRRSVSVGGVSFTGTGGEGDGYFSIRASQRVNRASERPAPAERRESGLGSIQSMERRELELARKRERERRISESMDRQSTEGRSSIGTDRGRISRETHRREGSDDTTTSTIGRDGEGDRMISPGWMDGTASPKSEGMRSPVRSPGRESVVSPGSGIDSVGSPRIDEEEEHDQEGRGIVV